MVNVIPQIDLDMRSKIESNKYCIYETDIDIMYVLRQEFFHLNKNLNTRVNLEKQIYIY